MTKHTPGPWEIVRGDEWTTDIGTPEVEYADGRKRHWNIASVNKRRDEWEANRTLIAAAPDLLEALEYLLTNYGALRYNESGKSQPDEAEIEARAAIAKATGHD